uniref:Probable 28S rRNA (Cytosine-C(5))-methyltransferase n=1 Tax=Phallusia mammillata TaxID=59560 RepID=A0A6F9DLZ4_9ASCI|nr:probable 28S rRNA (cytosine-C(5))-methyltransferase [Phallusia mammillata]
MLLYKTAESILQKAKKHQGSVKNLVFAANYKNPKQLFALVCETLKYWDVLEEIISQSKLRIKASSEMAALLVYDQLFGKGIQCGGKLKFLVAKHKLLLQSTLVRVKVKRGAVTNSELLSNEKSMEPLPKYLRINTLLIDKQSVVNHLVGDGYSIITKEKSLAKMEIKVDDHIANLLTFHHRTDLHDHPLYTNGKIIFQDKASCMPAQILDPQPDTDVIDACAAPGNKTSHIAALMKNTGKLFAFDLDDKRLKTMNKLLAKAGVKNCTTKCQDFLLVNPSDPMYSKVSSLLVDPSCSGSGIVSRLSKLVDKQSSDTETRLTALSDFQTKVLNHALLFPHAKRIVYSTCSVHEMENEAVVKKVLAQNPKFMLQQSMPSWKRRGNPTTGLEAEKLIRCDPVNDQTNGFFVALIVKKHEIEGTPDKAKKPKRKRRKK